MTTTFPAGKSRDTAMGVYAAMAGVGATVELLPGGVLTDAFDWRWVFFIDIPIGLAVLAGTKSLVEAERHPGCLDVPGAITGTGGLIALVHGITRGGGPPSAGSGREAAPAGYRGCEGRGRPRNSPGPSGIVRRAARTPRTGRFPQRHDTSGPSARRRPSPSTTGMRRSAATRAGSRQPAS
ncbi:hypothetical protein PV379_22910 [Streptomyces caniscabiei]|uniref:MFS transporter n=1 Tax=Streptomyces caniscabiei TaxID=2746961 RepID=UPI00299FB949|nr:MFS transporter [Streptomyces caniscabiei]MDX2604280.1 hypothetical protein [Streptomyces caniscabiei]MDX2735622.1 hypothetical protein [Streptomyces caniscabiei]MDX2780145.1 hypothetical protein [Streptomyces caniscabiei]